MMDKQESILERGQKRGASNNGSYAGSLNPTEAFNIAHENSKVLLVDVRSKAELGLVVRIPMALHCEWAFYPGMIANENFVQELTALIEKKSQDKSQILIFVCRTGARSHHAANVAANLGYTQVYNMLEGFEGETNASQQRTLINGWKHAGLPWVN